jgi:hypothetical protein
MQLDEEYKSVSYTITLGPGTVRYLSVQKFLLANPDEVIAQLSSLSDKLEIQSPSNIHPRYHFDKTHLSDEIRKRNKEDVHGRFFLDLAEYDSLFKNEAWEQRLRQHHKLGHLFLSQAMPSSVYCNFYEFFRLTEHAVDECLKSWVKQAFLNFAVTESYRKSNEHLIVKHAVGRHEFDYVFQRTPFVLARLDSMARNEVERKATLDLDLLRRSEFDCYIYLMEDLRNKKFKIGKSKTPGKRERTLQSEVPQIVIRFSIPAEEIREIELHERFDDKRIRGEWFALSGSDLAWLVSFLKTNGDISRAFVDFDWLGRIHFNG